MKNTIFILFTFCTIIANGQIFTKGAFDGSFTITPKGLEGSTNAVMDYTNVAVGTYALSANTTGKQNVAFGYFALTANTIGSYNTAHGNYALSANKGSQNTASGYYALSDNVQGGGNTANGYYALKSNLSGANNTASGASALDANTSGSSNVANGQNSLGNNTSGNQNTATGAQALGGNTTGNYNTGDGATAGNTIVAGSYNTFLGYAADATGDFSNATAIGANAKVNDNNKVRIGNDQITVIEGQVAWSYPSDRRLKENIVATKTLGLDFISRLNTASYNYIADKNKTRYDGFIAQDIEQVMHELGIKFSGLKKSNDGMYSLAYSDFVMPLVNAVKELKSTNETLSAALNELKAEVANLKTEEK